MKKKGRNLLILVVILILLLVAYVTLMQYNKNQEEEKAPEEDTSVTVGTTDRNTINQITVSGDEGTYSITKSGDSWVYADDESLPLNQTKVSEMLNMLSEVKAVRTVDNSVDNMEEYGLKVPRITIQAATDDGASHTYNIGASNKTTGDYYLSTDSDDKIYTVTFDFYYAFSHSLAGMIQTESVPKIDTKGVNGFTVEASGKTWEFVYMPGSVTSDYSGSYRWFMRSPFEKLTAIDTGKAESLLSDAVGLSYNKCAAYNAGATELEQYGLSQPKATLTVDYVETTQEKVEGSDQTMPTYTPKIYKLHIGSEAENETYVMPEGSSMVYTMSTSLLSDLLSIDEREYLPLDVCLIKLDDVASMTVTTAQKSYDIKIARTESEDADGNKTTVTDYTVNGKAADESAFKSFYSQITDIKGEKRLSKGETVEDTAYVTIDFTLSKEGFENMTLKFTPYDNNFYRAQFNTYNDLLVNRRDVESILNKLSVME